MSGPWTEGVLMFCLFWLYYDKYLSIQNPNHSDLLCFKSSFDDWVALTLSEKNNKMFSFFFPPRRIAERCRPQLSLVREGHGTGDRGHGTCRPRSRGASEGTQCAGKQTPTADSTFTWRLMKARDIIEWRSLYILNLYGWETEGSRGGKIQKEHNTKKYHNR